MHINAFNRNCIFIPEACQKKGIYFVSLTEEGEYLGGAWLFKKSAKKILKETRLASSHLKKCQYLWELGGIYTCLMPDNNMSEKVTQFYQGLYQQLVVYGQKNNLQHVVVHASSTEK